MRGCPAGYSAAFAGMVLPASRTQLRIGQPLRSLPVKGEGEFHVLQSVMRSVSSGSGPTYRDPAP